MKAFVLFFLASLSLQRKFKRAFVGENGITQADILNSISILSNEITAFRTAELLSALENYQSKGDGSDEDNKLVKQSKEFREKLEDLEKGKKTREFIMQSIDEYIENLEENDLTGELKKLIKTDLTIFKNLKLKLQSGSRMANMVYKLLGTSDEAVNNDSTIIDFLLDESKKEDEELEIISVYEKLYKEETTGITYLNVLYGKWTLIRKIITHKNHPEDNHKDYLKLIKENGNISGKTKNIYETLFVHLEYLEKILEFLKGKMNFFYYAYLDEKAQNHFDYILTQFKLKEKLEYISRDKNDQQTSDDNVANIENFLKNLKKIDHNKLDTSNPKDIKYKIKKSANVYGDLETRLGTRFPKSWTPSNYKPLYFRYLSNVAYEKGVLVIL